MAAVQTRDNTNYFLLRNFHIKLETSQTSQRDFQTNRNIFEKFSKFKKFWKLFEWSKKNFSQFVYFWSLQIQTGWFSKKKKLDIYRRKLVIFHSTRDNFSAKRGHIFGSKFAWTYTTSVVFCNKNYSITIHRIFYNSTLFFKRFPYYYLIVILLIKK